MRNQPNNKWIKPNIKKNDIIAFESPLREGTHWFLQMVDTPIKILSLGIINLDSRQLIIKRVIAGPGDFVSVRDKVVYVNQKEIVKNWDFKHSDPRIFPHKISSRDNIVEIFIPNNHYFVLSQNWKYENDSRSFGLVPLYKIEGVHSP